MSTKYASGRTVSARSSRSIRTEPATRISFTPETASWLRDRLRGRQVDRSEAGAILAPAAERLDLPFTYGDKLGHYATKVLLVLVAREEAGVRKVGRRFIYTVY